MFCASSLRIAIMLPRNSYAIGSPDIDLNTGFIVVPFIIPKSKSRLFKCPCAVYF